MGLFDRYTIIDQDPESPTFRLPYMTRTRLGRLMYHVIYRRDDDDPHDHPWWFVTFPLTSYVEEVTLRTVESFDRDIGAIIDPPLVEFVTFRRAVRAFHFHYREAHFIHRILGPWTGEDVSQYPAAGGYERGVGTGTIRTIVWRGPEIREWGFWKTRLGKTCWQIGREYYSGGKRKLCD